MASSLELIFHIIREVCDETGKSLEEVLKNPKLVKRFAYIDTSVSTSAFFYKKSLIKDLLDIYNSASGLSKIIFVQRNLSNKMLESRLEELSIMDLESALKKARISLFRIRHLVRLAQKEAC